MGDIQIKLEIHIVVKKGWERKEMNLSLCVDVRFNNWMGMCALGYNKVKFLKQVFIKIAVEKRKIILILLCRYVAYAVLYNEYCNFRFNLRVVLAKLEFEFVQWAIIG